MTQLTQAQRESNTYKTVYDAVQSTEGIAMAKSYQGRMYDKQVKVELRVKDAHSAAICYQSNFESYLASMDRIFKSRDYVVLPHWRKSYLRGIYDTLFGQLQNTFVWILTGPDGKRYGPGNDAWLEQDREYKEAMQGTHVWPKAWQAGEYRPFN